MQDHDTQERRDAALLAGGALVSRLLGLARDLLAAFLLGPAADAFLVAFRLPNAFRRLLAEGSLGLAFGAAVARILNGEGAARAANFSRETTLTALLWSLPFCLLLALLARPLIFILAPGLAPEAARQSALLLRLCLAYLPLCLYSALAFARAAAYGDMRPQAWSPALFNIVMLAFGLTAALAAEGPADGAVLLSLGVVAGGLAQAWAGRRCIRAVDRDAPPERDGAETKRARAFVRSLPAGVLGSAPHQLHILAGMMLASLAAPGCISALYFAERLVELPLGLGRGRRRVWRPCPGWPAWRKPVSAKPSAFASAKPCAPGPFSACPRPPGSSPWAGPWRI